MQYISDREKILEFNKELGLPYLTGSLKQIAWADRIRINILRPMKYLAELNRIVSMEEYEGEKLKEEARYWIDMNDAQWFYLAQANEHYFSQTFPERFIYRPENPVKDGMVDIIHLDGVVYYKYPYDADYVRLMDGLKYVGGGARKGQPFWLKKRARQLLLSGFTLNCDTELDIDQTVSVPEDLLDDD